MAKRGVYVVLVGCVLINVLFTLDQPTYVFNSNFLALSVITINVSIGLALLSFPLIGLLADVRFTRYQMMKTSFAILSMTIILFFIVGIIAYVVFHMILHQSIPENLSLVYVFCIVFLIPGIGLYQVNAFPIWYGSAS